MTIAPLSQSLIRAIGSSQVLSDSASVAKELIDNALDARASSIIIEISLNTLDLIQVKDDGHGIPSTYREVLCRRYFTSKISEFNDLSTIGGTWLGFRGVALASAVELSGELSISTRTEGESVAELLNFNGEGGLIGRQKCSHPTGTTVRISDFLKDLPVRRQSLLKRTSKTITKLKSIVTAYALARPAIRFAMKILQAKTENAGIVYVPKPEASVKDAALKLIGSITIAQCEWRTWSSAETDLDPSLIQKPDSMHFILHTLLPKSDANLSSFNSQGRFISIDKRPVSSVRGTIKKLVKLFKNYLTSSQESGKVMIEPFFVMDISCPPGAYDINIEPEKDDVIFTDESRLLEVCELFFQSVYGNIQERRFEPQVFQDESNNASCHPLRMTRPDEMKENSFKDPSPRPHKQPDSESSKFSRFRGTPEESWMLPGKFSVPLSDISNCSTIPTGPRYSQASIQKPFQLFNPRNKLIDSNREDDVEMLDATTIREGEFTNAITSNPWTIAKMNTCSTSKPNRQQESALRSHGDLMTPRKQLGDLGWASTPPRQSFQSQAGKIARGQLRQGILEALPSPSSKDQSFVVENPSLNQWTPINPASATRSSLNTTSAGGTPLKSIPSISERPQLRKPSPVRRRFPSTSLAPDQSQSLLLEYLPRASHLPKPSSARPFQRVLKDNSPGRSDPRPGSQSTITATQSPPTIPAGQFISLVPNSCSSHTQEEQIQERTPSSQCQSEISTTEPGPQPQPQPQNSPQPASCLLSTNPRHHLLCPLNEGTTPPRSKLQRRITASVLPFESGSAAHELCALRLGVRSVAEAGIRALVVELAPHDEYVRTGAKLVAGFVDAPRVALEFEDVVLALVQARHEKRGCETK